MKIAMTFSLAALLLAAGAAVALPQPAAISADQSASQSANQTANRNSSREAKAKRMPHATSKAEFEAYQSAAALTDPARLEAAATSFAQRYPASELRPYLFQRAMGLYQQANDPVKSLEMARAVLKYDPANAVALLAAGQLLAEGTHGNDLDRNARLDEAGTDARGALQHAGDLARPANLTAEQFADAIAQLRGAAHEVIATVAYKKADYFDAIQEYNAAAVEEKEHTDPIVWLRLAVAHDKSGQIELGIAYAEKAIATSESGSPVHELAAKEKARLEALLPVKPAQKPSGITGAPGSGEGSRAD